MKTFLFILLGLIEAFVAIGAFYGGWHLITDPTGRSIQLQMDWLKHSPFADFFIPGVLLFTVNGLGSAFASTISFTRSGLAGWLGVLIGLGLMIWIGVQVYYTGFVFFLQPLFGAIGLVELLLGIILLRMAGKQPHSI